MHQDPAFRVGYWGVGLAALGRQFVSEILGTQQEIFVTSARR